MDCVVLGPFAAAELCANMHLHDTPPLPVPQYQRGSPLSREFTSWGATGGSDARKTLTKQLLQHVDAKEQDVVVGSVKTSVLMPHISSYIDSPNSMSCRVK